MARKKKNTYEFKPDPKGTNFLKRLYLTRQQRMQILRWTLFSLVCMALLIIQDVILSRIRISGATTDLVPCIILLISIYMGLEKGSLFCLIASTVYWFSGSAPGPYVIALMVYLTVGLNLLRQTIWNPSFGSTVLCTWIALLLYEMGLFIIGVFLNLTIWSRAGIFLLTGGMTCLLVLPLYPLVRAIAKIGGDTWKE